MYKSPIEITQTPIQNILKQIDEQKEEYIYESVVSVGVDVDKEELIKALQYDRGQYRKGYDDGYEDGIRKFAEKLKEYYSSIANGIDYTAEEVLKD